MPRWDSNPQSQQAAAEDLRLSPRGHWDRLPAVTRDISLLQNARPSACSVGIGVSFCGGKAAQCEDYTAFGMCWHTVTHGRGSEGETSEWSG